MDKRAAASYPADMRFETALTNPEKSRAETLADAAERLAPSLDLERQRDLHVYKALDQAGIADPVARRKLIPEIKKILHRRRPIPFSERQDLIEDARVQELRHPDDEDEG